MLGCKNHLRSSKTADNSKQLPRSVRICNLSITSFVIIHAQLYLSLSLTTCRTSIHDRIIPFNDRKKMRNITSVMSTVQPVSSKSSYTRRRQLLDGKYLLSAIEFYKILTKPTSIYNIWINTTMTT